MVQAGGAHGQAKPFSIVDTRQVNCYDSLLPIIPPSPGNLYYGQDAQFDGNQPSYEDNGTGPQGDVVRIYNYVRLVRSDSSVGMNETDIRDLGLNIYPNPFTGRTTIDFTLSQSGEVTMKVFNI
jgi:hypothetical protein